MLGTKLALAYLEVAVVEMGAGLSKHSMFGHVCHLSEASSTFKPAPRLEHNHKRVTIGSTGGTLPYVYPQTTD